MIQVPWTESGVGIRGFSSFHQLCCRCGGEACLAATAVLRILLSLAGAGWEQRYSVLYSVPD